MNFHKLIIFFVNLSAVLNCYCLTNEPPRNESSGGSHSNLRPRDNSSIIKSYYYTNGCLVVELVHSDNIRSINCINLYTGKALTKITPISNPVYFFIGNDYDLSQYEITVSFSDGTEYTEFLF
jgi:hypothetical protein